MAGHPKGFQYETLSQRERDARWRTETTRKQLRKVIAQCYAYPKRFDRSISANLNLLESGTDSKNPDQAVPPGLQTATPPERITFIGPKK